MYTAESKNRTEKRAPPGLSFGSFTGTTVKHRGIAFLVTLALGFLGTLLTAHAQDAPKVPRIGFLWPGFFPTVETEAFREGLRRLGYVDGHNIALEHRAAEERHARLPDLAAELVRRKVDILVTAGTPAARAAKQATTTIPIVMAIVGDAVGAGLVSSLARPGGNVTGLSFFLPELSAKRLALLKEAVPATVRVALLVNPDNPSHALAFKATESTARSLRVELRQARARERGDVDGALRALASWPMDALIILEDTMLGRAEERIAEFAAAHRLPTVAGRPSFTTGVLLGYGVNRLGFFSRAAVFVDKILKGAKPGDLPIEQPATFELIVNLKTARTLGLTIPQSILIRADTVIE